MLDFPKHALLSSHPVSCELMMFGLQAGHRAWKQTAREVGHKNHHLVSQFTVLHSYDNNNNSRLKRGNVCFCEGK